MMQKNKVSCCFRRVMFWSLLLAFPLIYTVAEELLAQEVRLRDTPAGRLIELSAPDGRTLQLRPAADDDEDGIDNSLEINGFTYSPGDGLQPWDGDSSAVYFKTDPLRWSTDGDPYSDFMEVSGVNMPAGVPSPENNPLVAARPVINIGMTDYDVIPISEITTSEGGEQSSSFTNETSSSDEVGGEVTVGAELNPFKLVSAEVTASYSHTWTRTQSTTSEFGSNWSTARSTNPSQAARLKLRIFLQNLGSATALNVTPTFNLVLGEKTIATIIPNQSADRLAPRGLPKSRYPEAGSIVIEKDDQNNDIILSLEELKAIQMGAPPGLVVTQVQADVARWNPDTQSYDSQVEWSSFEAEIDPVVVTIKANLGDDEIYNYQVYVGTDFYTLDFDFGDVLTQVFELEEPADPDGQVFVENARGDVTAADIILPALYTSAADVKAFSSLLPSSGGEYLLFSGGDSNKPVKLYCLFDDPKAGAPLDTPLEYLSLPVSNDASNFKATEPPDYSGDSQGFVGLKADSIALIYKRDFYNGAQNVNLPGNSLQFNLSSSEDLGYVNMGSSNTLEVSDAITFEAWIKPQPNSQEFMDMGIIVNREGEYELARFPDGTIRWAIANDSPGWIWMNTGYVARGNEWVHIALVYDRNNPEPAILTYINGNLFQAMKGEGPIGDHEIHQDQDDFRIGGRQAFDTPFFGTIDEVRLWSVARTEEQIRTALVDTLGPEIYASEEKGLIGYWRFDALEDLGIGGDGADDVRDYSVNSNHGDVLGDALLAGGTTAIDEKGKQIMPGEFILRQNYPNPFNPETHIQFQLPRATAVRLEIFNLLGQKVATLVDGHRPAGEHTIRLDGRDHAGQRVASGLYLYRLQAAGLVQTRKMMMLK